MSKVAFTLPWMPAPWKEAEILSRAAKGPYEDQLDFIPFERVSAALSSDAAKAGFPEFALRLAYRHAFFRVNYAVSDTLALDGIERRPYLLRAVDSKNYSGALSGVVLVRPQINAGRLMLKIKVDQRAYYDDQGSGVGAAIETQGRREAWKNHKYTQNFGRPVLDKLTLRRHGQEMPLEERDSSLAGLCSMPVRLPTVMSVLRLRSR